MTFEQLLLAAVEQRLLRPLDVQFALMVAQNDRSRPPADGAVSGISNSGALKRNIRILGGGNRRAINSNCPSPARPRLTFTRYS
ncbi:hypothetical protein CQA86_03220 [Klebsiella pneumoniae]|nr:hypothetical protein CQA86_03220 [Klebsiella pneumoniae]